MTFSISKWLMLICNPRLRWLASHTPRFHTWLSHWTLQSHSCTLHIILFLSTPFCLFYSALLSDLSLHKPKVNYPLFFKIKLDYLEPIFYYKKTSKVGSPLSRPRETTLPINLLNNEQKRGYQASVKTEKQKAHKEARKWIAPEEEETMNKQSAVGSSRAHHPLFAVFYSCVFIFSSLLLLLCLFCYVGLFLPVGSAQRFFYVQSN